MQRCLTPCCAHHAAPCSTVPSSTASCTGRWAIVRSVRGWHVRCGGGRWRSQPWGMLRSSAQPVITRPQCCIFPLDGSCSAGAGAAPGGALSRRRRLSAPLQPRVPRAGPLGHRVPVRQQLWPTGPGRPHSPGSRATETSLVLRPRCAGHQGAAAGSAWPELLAPASSPRALPALPGKWLALLSRLPLFSASGCR